MSKHALKKLVTTVLSCSLVKHIAVYVCYKRVQKAITHDIKLYLHEVRILFGRYTAGVGDGVLNYQFKSREVMLLVHPGAKIRDGDRNEMPF